MPLNQGFHHRLGRIMKRNSQRTAQRRRLGHKSFAAKDSLAIEPLEPRYLLSGRSPVAENDYYDVVSGSALEARGAQSFSLTAQQFIWAVEDGGNGHVYEKVPVSKTWQAANTEASQRSLGNTSGHLATITSAAESTFIVNNFQDERIWIGGYQDHTAPNYSEPSGGWRWVTEEPWEYTNWNSFEPNDAGNEDYVEMGDGFRWNDLAGGNGLDSYLVEYPIKPVSDQQSLVDAGSEWYYLDDGTDPDVSWQTVSFDDSTWSTGSSEFGYGEGDEATVVNSGNSTTYFRHIFRANSPDLVESLSLYLKRDDGAVVYLNGAEIVRDGLPVGATVASTAGDDGQSFHWFEVDPTLLNGGSNVLAVAVHQDNTNSDDLSFDAQLSAITTGTHGVLDNDTDPENDNLAAVVVDGALNGSLSFDTNGEFTYTPNPGFTGTDQFTYRANDGSSQSNIATVAINVRPANTSPISDTDDYSTIQNEVLIVDMATGLLANDSDGEGDPMIAVLVTPPAHGELVLNSDGSFQYTPDSQSLGDVDFTYVVIDGRSVSEVTTATIDVQSVPNVPTALNDAYEVFEGDTLVVDGPTGSDLPLTSSQHLWAAADGGNGHVYERVSNRGDWITAATAANARSVSGSDGHLATITSASEDSFLKDKLSGIDAWLGGYQDIQVPDFSEPRGGWRWVTGETWLYSNWGFSNPDSEGEEFLSTLDGWDHEWNDITGTYSMPAYWVEYPLASPIRNEVLIPHGDTWKYLDEGSDQGSFWMLPGADDSTWQTGVAQLGYGDGDEQTHIRSGSITTYFRRAFDATNVRAVDRLEILVKRDDGIAVYLNGIEIVRNGIPANAHYRSTALEANDDGAEFYRFSVDPSLLSEGSNLIAAEVHQNGGNSNDMSFDLQFTATYGVLSGLLANDSDPEDDDLSALLVSAPANGSVNLGSDGLFTYTPNAGFTGTDQFTYRATDGFYQSAPATVTIDVLTRNDAPVAVEDFYQTDTDVTLSVTPTLGILSNDRDTEGDMLSAILVSPPEHGTLSLNDDGSFTYAPDAQFKGMDQFAYRVNDGELTSNVAIVAVDVLGVPNVPIARNDHFSVLEDQTLVVENTLQQSIQKVTVPGGTLRQLAYDATRETIYVAVRDNNTVIPIDVNTGEKGEPLVIPSSPDEVVVTDNGQYLYIGADGANAIVRVDLATNTIDQTISLGDIHADDLLVLPGVPESIVVAKHNWGGVEVIDNAVRRPQSERWTQQIEINEDGTTLYGVTASSSVYDVKQFNITASGLEFVTFATYTGRPGRFYYEDGLLFFDGSHIIDAQTLQFLGSFNRPFAGEVVPLTQSNQVAYVTDEPDTIQISNVTTQQRVANIQVPGQPWAHHPISFGDDGIAFVGDEEHIYLVRSDLISGVTRHDILANDNDPEDDPLTLTLERTTQHGTLNLHADGTFDYLPNPNFHGIDAFTYTLSDGQFVSNTATVTIEVTPVNDLPIATQDIYRFTVIEQLLIGVEDGVLANDSDPDGTVLTAVLVGQPSHGSLAFRADGSFDYTPGPTFTVVDQFTYRASDGIGASTTTAVTLTLSDSDESPIAIDDTFSAVEDTLLVVSPDVSNPPQVVVNEEYISVGSDWRYLDDGSNQGLAWTSPAYDDSGWSSGAAELGYGDGDETTVVSYGLSSSNKHITTYFRHEFWVGAASQVISLALSLKRDDGAAVYLNGVEIARDNLQPNADYDTAATNTAGDDGEGFLTFEDIETSLLIDGVNVLAVEIHQQSSTSSDISFDLGLSGEVAKSTSVLENDFSPIGASISARLVDQTLHGSVTLNADGTFEYLPDVNFFGTDEFTYEATDGTHVSRVATAVINVSPVNDPPQAQDDLFRVGKNQTLTVTAVNGVLSNDVDVDSDDLFASLVNGPAYGGLSMQPDGSFVYTPGASFELTDSFTYLVHDGSVDSEVTTVKIELDVPSIALREFYLRPNTPDQQVFIHVTSEHEVSGVNFFLQVGDGGPELGDFGIPPGSDGPAITGVDLKTGTIFQTINDPQIDQPGIPQVATSTISISADGQSVLADGLLATVTIDTTGFFAGNWDLQLSDVLPYAALSGPFTTDFAGIPIHITNGQLVIRQTEVTGRHVIYGGSSFADSLASDKTPLLPGESASFANYTSYSRGLNGLVVDVANLLAAPTVDDFEFRVGRNGDFSSWTEGPAPSEFVVTSGAGAAGADRIVIRWQNGDIFNYWLKVTMLPSTETGLVAKDVFYFGNAPGDTGDSTTNALVNATDVVDTRDNKKGPFNPAGIEDRFDFNRDGLVNATDVIFARDNITSPFTALQLITPDPEPASIPRAARVPRAPLQSRAIGVFITDLDDTTRTRRWEEVPIETVDAGGDHSSEITSPLDRRIAHRQTTLARRTIRVLFEDRLQHVAESDVVFAQDAQWRSGIWGA